MIYELRDTSGKRLAQFSTRAAALDHIRRLIEVNTREGIKGLALISEDAHGRTKQVARGHNLANMAIPPIRGAG